MGEEAVSVNPDILKKLSGTAPVWVVDPVDGTSNFVAGVPDYACLVSLGGQRTHHRLVDLRPIT